MTEQQPVIDVRQLTKVYAGEGDAEVHALAGVNLSVQPGEYVALMGASGSGKSTLMHIIGCLDYPTSGEYYLGGEDTRQLSEGGLARIRNERIGFVFQAFNLLARTSALKNVELPLAYRGTPPRERERLARIALERVGLGERLHHKPNELSGGQKQRVAIARALVQNPTVLLADEPTGNLDSKSTGDILNLFDELHAEGRTIVLVTHEDEVGARAGRVVWMKDGKIVEGMQKAEGERQMADGGSDAQQNAPSAFSLQPSAFCAPEGHPMNFLENLRTALSAISSNKLRSLLTMLGVIIGVYAVSTMLALGQMATGAITSQLNEIGGRTISVGPDYNSAQRFHPFTTQDVEALAALPIQNVSTVDNQVQASTPLKSGTIYLSGTTADYVSNASGMNIKAGRYFTDTEARGSASVVVLTEKAVSKYFGGKSPVGQNVRIQMSLGPDVPPVRDQLTVIGVTADPGGLLGGLMPEIGYVPISYAWRYFAERDTYPSLSFRVSPGADADRVQSDITRLLSARRGQKDFQVQSADQFVNQFKMITGVLQAALAGIGGLSLLVGGIGIMNIMLVSVTERTREIGLRKALGARRSTIMGQFLIEAVTLTGLGGLIGYALSVVTVLLVTLAAPKFFPQMVLSPSVAALALGVSALIGLVFGVWPASRAASLTPIEALRYE